MRAAERPVHDRQPVPAVSTHVLDLHTSCVKISWSGVAACGYTISLYLMYAEILNLRGEG